jgi:phosphatidylglycerol lysyltransferase
MPLDPVSLRRERVRDLVMKYGWNATCYQMVNPIFEYAFYPDLDAVVAFVRARGCRVVAGAPVCPIKVLPEVFARFEAADPQRALYFGAGDRVSGESPANSVVSLGAQPVWNPQTWMDRVMPRQSLRYQFARARRKGVTVREWNTREAENSVELQALLDEWLGFRGLPPLHFLVEPKTLDYLRDRRTFVASVNDRPVAFLNLCPIPERRGWLTEQFPRQRHAPNGTVELLMHEAAQIIASEGAEYLTMGLVPFSQYGCPERNPAWLQTLVKIARRSGRKLYSFEGLDGFKSKFSPESWEPVYAVSPGRNFKLQDLLAIAEAFFETDPILPLLKAMVRRFI